MDTRQMIADQRIRNQQISHKQYVNPEEIVKSLGAVQAQDYLAALWAIGLRTFTQTTESAVEKAIAERKIVRTWPMRGTLHFVAAQDTTWMLNLLTPRVIRSSAGRYRELELDESVFRKSRKLIEQALQNSEKLTRTEFYQILEKNGISPKAQRGYHILAYLAQKGVICFGPRRGKQHTFVLLGDWITRHVNLKGDEALAELASRYITSHGPATEYDFSSWSGLTVTKARRAMEMVESEFIKIRIDGRPYWSSLTPANEKQAAEAYLLPAFDELICGYKDRSAVLESDQQKSVILKNGIIKPVILLGGKIAGTWKRTLKKKSAGIGVEPFSNLTRDNKEAIHEKIVGYGKFLGLKTECH